MDKTLLDAIPWLCLLLVFGGMAVLQWRALGSLHEIANLLAGILGQRPTPPVTPTLPKPVPVAPLEPERAPKPNVLENFGKAMAEKISPPASTAPGIPPWYVEARKEIGFHETGDNQGIEKYIALAKCGALGQPWCAIFVNAMLEKSGYRGSRSPSSQSFLHDENFIKLEKPVLGCIVVFWRISHSSGQGHVGFYSSETATHIKTLGGNEGDMVADALMPKDSPSFGFVAYMWPKTAPLPNALLSLPPITQTSAIDILQAQSHSQKNIIATVFGGFEGEQSAYGGPIIDESPGVALPLRFKGERSLVRVTNTANRRSVDCHIVDVGPWNIDDPYWETGTRPQSESGIDKRGRITNKAGIDLTPAAANAIGIEGKGLVDWEFVNSPSETQAPKVT